METKLKIFTFYPVLWKKGKAKMKKKEERAEMTEVTGVTGVTGVAEVTESEKKRRKKMPTSEDLGLENRIITLYKPEIIDSIQKLWESEETKKSIPSKLIQDSSKGKTFFWESQCRDIFESMTGYTFTKGRPQSLVNPKTKRRLELDGYNLDIPWKGGLGVAFEFNGPQHYKFDRKFHRSKKDLQEQKYRDSIKEHWAIANNVALLSISYLSKHRIDAIIASFIREKKIITVCQMMKSKKICRQATMDQVLSMLYPK